MAAAEPQPSQQATNYLSADAGATVLDCTHEAEAMGSLAANVLLEQEDHVWIADPPPQSITLALPSSHEPIRYVGWYVWHDYLTNPKTVDVFSGEDRDHLHHVITCNAYPGSGVQLWELTEPIAPRHRVMRFTVKATFGGSYTYMNRVYAFAEHPGSQFAPKAPSAARDRPRASTGTPPRQQRPSGIAAAAAPQSPGGFSNLGSPMHMSALLRDLDRDIRSLHPLHTQAPPPLDTSSRAGRSFQQQRQHGDGSTRDVSMAGGPPAPITSMSSGSADQQRIAVLEASIAQLIRTVDSQAKELAALRGALMNGGGGQHQQQLRPEPAPGPEYPLAFPEEALRNYVEDVMAPKLAKHSRRFEARVTQRLDEHLEELLRNVSAAVDERVARHMQKVAAAADERYRLVLDPRHAGKPSAKHASSR